MIWLFEKLKENWLLNVSYLLICALIYEVWVANQFYPYIYEFLKDKQEVYVENGIGQVVWGPYEINFPEPAHSDENVIITLVSNIRSTLLTLLTTLLALPVAFKDIKEKPTIWKKLGLVGIILFLAFLTYWYVSDVIELQPYLEQ